MCVYRGNEGLKWAKRVLNNNQVREEIKVQRNPQLSSTSAYGALCGSAVFECVCLCVSQ